MKYIEQTRAKIDRCNICGRRRELTWDHVPPKSSLLNPDTYASRLFNSIPSSNEHMIRYRNGIKYRNICKECNNALIGEYDKEYIKFTHDVAKALATSVAQETLIIVSKINRVLRAVCGHIMAMSTEFNRKTISDKQMRGYVLNDQRSLERIRIYTWFYPFSTIVNVKDNMIISKYLGTHPKGMVSVMESYPLAYMISTKHEDQCGIDDLSQYMTNNIDEEIPIILHLKTACYPRTKVLRHFLWPFNVVDEPYGAAMAIGGKDLDGSRVGVPK